jgi:hypothetical protein
MILVHNTPNAETFIRIIDKTMTFALVIATSCRKQCHMHVFFSTSLPESATFRDTSLLPGGYLELLADNIFCAVSANIISCDLGPICVAIASTSSIS